MTRQLPTDAERRLLSYDYAAAYLGLSVRGMKELAAEGGVRKVEIGSRILFDKVDLDAYITRIKRAS